MPVIRLNSVVLPAPFGPITLTISPLAHLEVEVADGPQAAEGLRDAASSSSGQPHHTSSTRMRPRSPCGRAIIITSRRPEQDLAGDRRLDDQPVLPHERRQVQDREQEVRQQPRPGPARPAGKTSTTKPIVAGRLMCSPGGHPVRSGSPTSRPLAGSPAVALGEIAPTIACKTSRTHRRREHGGQPAPRPDLDHQHHAGSARRTGSRPWPGCAASRA